jgi:hypothetical protein
MEREDWGYVAIIAGRHKGRIGLYDDDAERDLCVVYRGTPWATDYVLVKFTSLRRATKKEAERFAAQHETELASNRAWKEHFARQEGTPMRKNGNGKKPDVLTALDASLLDLGVNIVRDAAKEADDGDYGLPLFVVYMYRKDDPSKKKAIDVSFEDWDHEQEIPRKKEAILRAGLASIWGVDGRIETLHLSSPDGDQSRARCGSCDRLQNHKGDCLGKDKDLD